MKSDEKAMKPSPPSFGVPLDESFFASRSGSGGMGANKKGEQV